MQQALFALLLIMLTTHPGHIRPVRLAAFSIWYDMIRGFRRFLAARDAARILADDLEVILRIAVRGSVGTPAFPVPLALGNTLDLTAL